MLLTLSLSSVWEDFTIVAHWKVYESALIHVERVYVCVWLPQKKMSFVARVREHTENIVYCYACVRALDAYVSLRWATPLFFGRWRSVDMPPA